MKYGKIKSAINQLQKGDFIIIVDNEDRECEGDLMIAAEKITPSKLNKMINLARGIMCVPIAGNRLAKLKIPMMVNNPNDKFHTPFTISVDAKRNITTGVSVKDRVETIKVLINKHSKQEDISRPGHIFPLRAAENGVFERAGHTESAVDLCKLAGLYPAAVIAEIMKDDGSMAKAKDLDKFAKKHKLKIYTVKDLIEYRKEILK